MMTSTMAISIRVNPCSRLFIKPPYLTSAATFRKTHTSLGAASEGYNGIKIINLLTRFRRRRRVFVTFQLRQTLGEKANFGRIRDLATLQQSSEQDCCRVRF